MDSGALMRADLRPLLSLLLPLLWNTVALADTVQCVAGGSAAAPLAWDDAATWSPAAVPDGASDVLLDAACTVRCAAGECRAHTLKGTHAGAAIEIAPGATLVLAGYEDSDATGPLRYGCGGEDGFRFAPQGAVLHDSASGSCDVVHRGATEAHEIFEISTLEDDSSEFVGSAFAPLHSFTDRGDACQGTPGARCC